MKKIYSRLFWFLLILAAVIATIWYLTRPRPVIVALYTVDWERVFSNLRIQYGFGPECDSYIVMVGDGSG